MMNPCNNIENGFPWLAVPCTPDLEMLVDDVAHWVVLALHKLGNFIQGEVINVGMRDCSTTCNDWFFRNTWACFSTGTEFAPKKVWKWTHSWFITQLLRQRRQNWEWRLAVNLKFVALACL